MRFVMVQFQALRPIFCRKWFKSRINIHVHPNPLVTLTRITTRIYLQAGNTALSTVQKEPPI